MTQRTPDATPPEQDHAPTWAGHWRFSTGMGVGLLMLVTVAGLCGAWWWPERTEWHFLIVTQCIPLCYLGLAWWGSHSDAGEDDGS